MSYRGDVRLGATVHLKFSTVNTSAVPTTLVSGTVSAYPDSSTTELTAGVTLTTDFDGRTGLHHVAVVASSGNGYLTATNYDLVLTAGTVGGTSVVGMVVGSFSIEARSALMPTTAGQTLTVTTGNVTVGTNSDKTGYRLSSTGVDDILDATVEGSVTLRQSQRLSNAAAGGKLSGAATTTVAIRDLADTKDRVSATVDANGNRSAITRDLT